MTQAEKRPQVVLFGSIGGDWREQHIIPVLASLDVTYFDPRTGTDWTEEMGVREAEAMAHCETIVMYFNNTSPAFGGLAEAGWAALGTLQRNQTLILCVERDYTIEQPWWARFIPGRRELLKTIEEYAVRSRFLMLEHAQHLATENDRIVIAENIEGINEELRKQYNPS